LKSYFDKLAEDASLRAILPTDDNDRRVLDNELRTNRLALHRAPAAEDTSPPAYHGDGTTPLGAPTTLNSEVTVGNIRMSQGARTPFGVNLPTAPTAHHPIARKRFGSQKYCITCGFKRSDHVVADDGVADKCGRNYCGKCRERGKTVMVTVALV
jgi:hypothetical protein